MRALLSLFLLYSFSARATTSAIFGKNDVKATVFLKGAVGDDDALRFYERLYVEEKDFNGQRSKTLRFEDSGGTRVLQVACVFSRLFAENGSCAIVFYEGEGVTIDSAAGLIEYSSPTSQDAARLKEFLDPYLSNDSRFAVEVQNGQSGIESLSLRYR